MSQTTHLRTRYPGLASFTTADKDLFFGRKQETRELANLLSVERTVVLFSASGLGKTSLLQAGVMPLLYGQLMVPVPIRFGTAALLPEQHFSIQLDAAHRRFSSADDTKAADSSARESFWAQIARRPFGQAPALFTPLFIFDQFEELFTLYPEREKRARFVAELADIIQERIPAALRSQILEGLDQGKITSEAAAALEKAPPMKFIFSIRSDMLHFMDELSEAIPYILRSRFQLFGLSLMQATEAIAAPAALAGVGFQSQRFGYSAEAQSEILEVLGKKGEVESFQLQAVCQAIEEKIIGSTVQKSDKTNFLEKNNDGLLLVTPDFYGGREGIDAILDKSYNRRLDGLGAINPGWPMIAHRLIEEALITPNDRRQSVDREVLLRRKGMSLDLLDELERQRLVRKEPKLESFYYEISHDTWLKSILKSRKERLEREITQRIEAEKKAMQEYKSLLESLSKFNGKWPDTARKLLEGILLSVDGKRLEVIEEVLLSKGIDRQLLDELCNIHLIEKDLYADLGSYYYHISDEIWVAPISFYRKERMDQAVLLEAKANARKARQVAIVLGSLALLAAVFAVFAVMKTREANVANARSNQKLLEALHEKGQRLDGEKAQLLRAQAVYLTAKDSVLMFETKQALVVKDSLIEQNQTEIKQAENIQNR